MRAAERLAELELVEGRLRQLEAERAEAADRRAGDPELSRLEDRAHSLEQELRAAAAELRRIELDVAELRERAGSHERAIYGGAVRHPAELEKYQHEVRMLKDRIAAEEELELAAMEAQERLEAELATGRTSVRERSLEVDRLRDLDLKRGPGLEEALGAARTEHDEIADSLPPGVLRAYQRTAARRTPAVARVVQGVCGGCRLPVAHRLLEEARGDQLVTCENCERILLL